MTLSSRLVVMVQTLTGSISCSSVIFPRQCSNDSGVHGRNTFTAEDFVWDYAKKSTQVFSMPSWTIQPLDTHFSDTRDPGCCPAWWTVSPFTI